MKRSFLFALAIVATFTQAQAQTNQQIPDWMKPTPEENADPTYYHATDGMPHPSQRAPIAVPALLQCQNLRMNIEKYYSTAKIFIRNQRAGIAYINGVPQQMGNLQPSEVWRLTEAVRLRREFLLAGMREYSFRGDLPNCINYSNYAIHEMDNMIYAAVGKSVLRR